MMNHVCTNSVMLATSWEMSIEIPHPGTTKGPTIHILKDKSVPHSVQILSVKISLPQEGQNVTLTARKPTASWMSADGSDIARNGRLASVVSLGKCEWWHQVQGSIEFHLRVTRRRNGPNYICILCTHTLSNEDPVHGKQGTERYFGDVFAIVSSSFP
jgi:hypothetical protein